jgi:Ala-tRNA(Pro) deacylase
MILAKLETLLDVNGIHYTPIHKPAFTARDVANAEEMPVNRIAKCIVFFGEDGYGIVVVPGDDRKVDLHEMRELLRQPHLRLATEEELRKLFPESEFGAMPPFGNHVGLPVFVDNILAGQETITFNAGTHRDAIHLQFRDFERLSGATVLPCAVAVSRAGASG